MMEFLHKRHARYFKFCMDSIPGEYTSLDTSRMTLLFYAVSGLDLLGQLDLVQDKQSVIEWVYRQQITSELCDGDLSRAGFRGSPANSSGAPLNQWDCSHVTMTYTALATLLVLGDDLSRVDRAALLSGLRALQLPGGSFLSSLHGGESDMRFVYCAAAVSYMLDDWSGMDREKTREYVLRSMRYDHGISQGPLLESHGGSTFCAVATLALMGELESALTEQQRDGLVFWCLSRQGVGFNGRPNKQEDSCYTFWIGASLRLLDAYQFVRTDLLREFVYSAQDPITGGLSKWPGHGADPLHTYLGISGLSLAGQEGLKPIHAALNVSADAVEVLRRAQARWRDLPPVKAVD
ncbi:geranylgeranyl transferase type-1 subunit beta-like [Amphibalanus amphitrite]|uniref:geranylgeranyl transferase type-1 subunit beta-like n=1 Tax=Amphibalanus amphitrite TaxID=1232801 RepID=UPI001C9153C4|nr:geranylgeranyl transferase type-1 subunit beta-like [Amphibalanus amphitrite]XP_043226587.1 geranylgeranyl transferase type-1 subunit beta-like [Amphibalanus amphitrite]XP_043226588.1 geranylgeranyl transferase type-1 subunit beta-like [Amphibalanus amphitrite]